MPAPSHLLSAAFSIVIVSSLAAADTAPAPVLTLHDLLVNAVNANLELSARRIDPEIQQNRLDGAWGAFEPSWVAGYSYSSSERPQNYDGAGVLGGATGRYAPLFEENIRRGQTGITGRLPFGTQYELLTGVDRTDNTSIASGGSIISPGARFRPEYVSTSTLTITQPLLKDFGFAANLAEVRLQKSALKTARHDLTATALRILRDVASAYYEMVFAQENIRVKEEAIAVAEALVRDNQRRVDEGRMAPIDVTQANSRLSEAREELLLAQNFLAQRRNTLRELTRDQFDLDGADFTVDPSFIVRTAPAIDRDKSLDTLFKSNPTYLASVELASSEDIRIAYARNQRWPRVDLKASIGYNGLNDNVSSSYKDYGNRDEPTYSVGLVVNVPLGDRTGRARLAEARNRKRQALFALKRSEVVLLSAFDTAQRDIANAAERTRLVKDSVSLAAASLDAQQRILGSGKTTSYEVAQAQRDLSTARSRELATLVDLNKSIAHFEFVLGTIADYLRVDLKNES
jgi:outer membrane protein TolC